MAALALVAVAKQEANAHDRGSAIAAVSGEKKTDDRDCVTMLIQPIAATQELAIVLEPMMIAITVVKLLAPVLKPIATTELTMSGADNCDGFGYGDNI